MTISAISPDQLRAQAQISRDAGFTQLADNLERAAELTRVPNDALLRMYEKLRPGRSSRAELEAIEHELLEAYAAPLNAQLVREAIDVYAARDLFKRTAT